jgi:hypothetical protein
MSHNISHIICTACKKEGIIYCSINPAYNNFQEDAVRLGELYLQLKEIAGELQEIGERHNVEELKTLSHDIIKLEIVEHDIIRVANIIKKENKC